MLQVSGLFRVLSYWLDVPTYDTMKLMEAVKSHKPSTSRFLKRGAHDRCCFVSHKINAVNYDKD